MSNTLRWFADPAMDAPELRSPQPCPRGISCNYMIGDTPGSCRWVHPGEGGTGRRMFPAKGDKPPCVRLTGCHKDAGGGYYARRHAKMSWRQWAQNHGLPWTEETGPVTLLTMNGKPFPPDKQPQAPKKPAHLRQERVDLSVTVEFEPVLGRGAAGCSPGCACVWDGKCMDRQADENRQALAEFEARVAMHSVMQPGSYLRTIMALPARNLDPEFAAAALEYDARDLSDPDTAGSATPSLCFARGLGPKHTEGGGPPLSPPQECATPSLCSGGGCCAEGDATPTLLPRPGDATLSLSLSLCSGGDATPTLLPRPGDATPSLCSGGASPRPGTQSWHARVSLLGLPPPLNTIPGYTENEAPALASSQVEYEEQD
jgi:hypothetical protein